MPRGASAAQPCRASSVCDGAPSRTYAALAGLICDVGLQCRCGGNVRLSPGSEAFSQFCDTAPVVGPGIFRAEDQCAVIVGDRLVVVATAQLHESAAVEKGRRVGS